LLHLTYLGHATVLIQLDGLRVLTDPLLRQRASILRRFPSSIDPAFYENIDAVLISHLHLDHLDLPSLEKINRSARLFIPHGAARIVSKLGFENVYEMRVGDAASLGSVTIRSTYAEHSRSRYPFGPITDSLGFIISGEYRVYFSGDTDLFPSMGNLVDNLDIALLPVWGWGPTLRKGHLNPRTASHALAMLRPHLAIPIHWGTMAPLGLGWMKLRYLHQPPLDFKRYAAVHAPNVKVRIVSPGSSITYQKDSYDG